MPNILDSIVVELGMVTTHFDKGVKDAIRAMEKSKDETEKNTKVIAKSVGEEVSGAFQKATTRALEFFAVLAGARSIETFTANVTQGSVQLGIVSAQLGMTPERVSMIQMAVAQTGGTAEATTQSLRALNDIRQRVITGAEAPPIELQRLNVDVRGSKNAEDLLNKIVNGFQSTAFGRGLNENQKISILQRVGVDAATAKLWVEKGSAGAEAAVNATAPNATTGPQVAAANQLNAAWVALSQTVTSLGREIVRVISPALTRLLGYVRQLVERYKPDIENWFGEKVKEAVTWLTDPNTWKAILPILSEMWEKVKWLNSATSDWGGVTGTLLGLWTMNQIAPALTAIAALAVAFQGLWLRMFPVTAALAAGSLIAWFANRPPSTTTPEDAARARIDLQRRNRGQDPEEPNPALVQEQEFFDANAGFLDKAMGSTPESFFAWKKNQEVYQYGERESEERREASRGAAPRGTALETSEGPVGEAHPLPVRIVGTSSSTPVKDLLPPDSSPAPSPAPGTLPGTPPAAPEKEGWLHWGWRKLTGGADPAPAQAAPGASAPAPSTPRPSSATSQGGGFPAPHSATPLKAGEGPSNPGVLIIHGKKYRANPDGTVGDEITSDAGYARYALASPHVPTSSSKVEIAELRFHTTTTPGADKKYDPRKYIQRDFAAMKTDVGLA